MLAGLSRRSEFKSSRKRRRNDLQIYSSQCRRGSTRGASEQIRGQGLPPSLSLDQGKLGIQQCRQNVIDWNRPPTGGRQDCPPAIFEFQDRVSFAHLDLILRNIKRGVKIARKEPGPPSTRCFAKCSYQNHTSECDLSHLGEFVKDKYPRRGVKSCHLRPRSRLKTPKKSYIFRVSNSHNFLMDFSGERILASLRKFSSTSSILIISGVIATRWQFHPKSPGIRGSRGRRRH